MNQESLTTEPEAPVAAPVPAVDIDQLFQHVLKRVNEARWPEATYRLQFHKEFTFRDAAAIVPYLAMLGITHVYASPFLKAIPGSHHGYDIVDPTRLNPEIGTTDDFEFLVAALRTHGMQQILDMVPNHMGVGSFENVWWQDVLENGPSSQFAHFFDIDWMPLKPDLANKVLLPVLGDQYGKVLEDHQLQLVLDDGLFAVCYFHRRYPISLRTAAAILKHRLEVLTERLGTDHPQLLEYESILTAMHHLAPPTETDPDRIRERQREREVIKRRLNELVHGSPEVAAFLNENIELFNGKPGDPHSFDLLDQLLQSQSYRLSFWRVAADEINYRRFFDVNELAAINMERPEVFEAAHGFVFKLLETNKIQGLRIDHADGLYDPAEYLWRLQRQRALQFAREALPDAADSAPGSVWETELLARYEEFVRAAPHDTRRHALFTVIEKILEPGERLPYGWPVQGTTGYDFVNSLNRLYVDSTSAKRFDSLYAQFARQRLDLPELIYECKKLVIETAMSSEINVLGHQLDRISEQNRWSRDFTLNGLTAAIREIIACFPVYRTYITEPPVVERDRRYIDSAVASAKLRNPAINASIYDFVRDMLLLRYPEAADEISRGLQLRFARRVQQMTGPIMAKGVEDTAFYRFNRLISLNEVGGDPHEFGGSIAAFHQQNRERLTRWPCSMLATSTHDTKRSEDVRARINVLSELSAEWKRHVFRWTRVNQKKKQKREGEFAPSRNDEYLFYQTLVGIWPIEPGNMDASPQLIERLQQYMLKAVREAKVYSSWISPNAEYERGLSEFIEGTLTGGASNPFLKDFAPFAERISQFGIWNSLSQTVLKLASPGIPDIYQGTELWDFSLVDPDNRRPVDYERRSRVLSELLPPGDAQESSRAQQLLAERNDGRIKLLVLQRMLNFRKSHLNLCTSGSYTPLEVAGDKREHVCAFARVAEGQGVIVCVPRLVAGLLGDAQKSPTGEEVWGATRLILPPELQSRRYRNLYTGESIPSPGEDGGLAVAEILRSFPVAALELISPA